MPHAKEKPTAAPVNAKKQVDTAEMALLNCMNAAFAVVNEPGYINTSSRTMTKDIFQMTQKPTFIRFVRNLNRMARPEYVTSLLGKHDIDQALRRKVQQQQEGHYARKAMQDKMEKATAQAAQYDKAQEMFRHENSQDASR